MTPSLFNRWLFMAGLVLIGAFFFWWADISEQSSDGLQGVVSHHALPAEVQVDDIDRFRSLHSGIQADESKLELSDVRLEARKAGVVTASAHLTSMSSGMPYPHLVVVLSGADGQALRSIDLSPSQYEHGSALSDERVRFKFDFRAAERGLEAHASYPVSAHAVGAGR